VYGAVVCSYDAVSLFYLELYVKLSIYLSILRWLFAVPAHTPIEMLLHLGRLQTMTQRQVSLACRRERYKWSERFNKGPRLPCHAVFAALVK
jgi:hypothetical protein